MNNYGDRFNLSDTAMDRFVKYFNIPKNINECWEWSGNKNRGGYGIFKYNGANLMAHRLMFQTVLGGITSRKSVICHKCDNPKCINPTHLFLGTQDDNMKDKAHKTTHCRNGHEYTEDNLFLASDNRRRCKTCARNNNIKKSKELQEIRRKRGPLPRAVSTHCRNGHEYTKENIYIATDGKRRCRKCIKKFHDERYMRIKQCRLKK